ncbi:unnamed protein product [Chondrus crispus]|uniref:Cation-transporting P-type ATPase C-terminal domain-containing protein n=1 Tax=Chondrus crispus TaxID=2769 RepID=R7QAZ8_CHOCR|nr:unnamed protein product [Chondrus crispus]CDF34581.1 unnamed protein product [Chondrus crispus]|eukprot:XP_005714400.1 unnamed protein product [Chondrus crispus]
MRIPSRPIISPSLVHWLSMELALVLLSTLVMVLYSVAFLVSLLGLARRSLPCSSIFIISLSSFLLSQSRPVILFFIIGLIKGTEVITNTVFCIGIIVPNVPEGLLPTVTVFLKLSAKRMAKKQVLVKKLEAVETLGSTTCICSDKTGNLTQNQKTIVHLAYNNALYTTKTAATEATFDTQVSCVKELLCIGANCAKAMFDAKHLGDTPEKSIDERKVNGDASEAGILKFSEKITSVSAIRAHNTQVSTIPFNFANKFMITINKVADGGDRLRLCMKGLLNMSWRGAQASSRRRV